VSTNFEVNNEQNHGLAALALCAKLGWTGKMKAGGFKDDMYWVFEDSDWQIITAHNVSPVAVKGGK
jgi:hypothetical protein